MKQWNHVPILFWAFCAALGYLIGGDLKGAIVGLAIALGISLIAEVMT